MAATVQSQVEKEQECRQGVQLDVLSKSTYGWHIAIYPRVCPIQLSHIVILFMTLHNHALLHINLIHGNINA